MTVSGFESWKQDLHGTRVDPRPEEASQPTPGSILVSAAASVYVSREHGRLRTTRHFA